MRINDDLFMCDHCKAFGMIDLFWSGTDRPPRWVYNLEDIHTCSHDCWEALGLTRDDHICCESCEWGISSPFEAPEPRPSPPKKKIGPLERPGYVYFIQIGVGGPIKIGYSADVASRLRALQTSSPYELRVIAKVRGTQRDEQMFHRRFAAHRLSGEWFTASPEVCMAAARYARVL